MLRFILSLFLSLLLAPLTFAATSPNKITHVIYITLDGTRWQDVFLDHSRLPKFWEKYANTGTLYGEPDSRTSMQVASISVSLPSYQSQMAGSVQPCDENDCGRIKTQTFPEKLVTQYGFAKKDVVTFASWITITEAVESVFDTTFDNTGNALVYDPDTNIADPVMTAINNLQLEDHPDLDRYDKYTISQALHYFVKYQPKFMWLSLDDADEAAHDGNLEGYHQALTLYDDMLDKLFSMLEALHLDQQTMVILTTDHGRGDGDNWHDHGPRYPEASRTWAFVVNGALTPVGQEGEMTYYSTLSIRPTVEKAFAA